ncbi:Uncharacterised protein [Moraxella lacunata]|uniref:Surface-adhesin protein E-like domain-containing protein n=2 Tax=Moraxellaceae TaxID=468 RepID=A0A378QM72_MORLA|nr:surface-adhesin E family protein [Moraxella lacunata]STZ01530.1 Uncharacterised protein [Moraxella lacunata]
MKKLLIATLIALSPLSVHATNWVDIGSTSNFIYHIDRDSIQTHYFTGGGTYITAWVKRDYHQAQELSNGKKYWQTRAFSYYDCVARKSDFDYVIYYDKQSNSVDSFKRYVSTHSSKDWTRAVPDTVGEGKLDYACSQAGR